MAKKSTVVKKAKSGGKKKAGKKGATKPGTKKMTFHGVFDAMSAFEIAVRDSAHPRKKEMLKLADKSKKVWKAFCLKLSEDCSKPTDDFCESTLTLKPQN